MLLDHYIPQMPKIRKAEFHPSHVYAPRQTLGGLLYAPTRHQQTSQTCKVSVEFLSSLMALGFLSLAKDRNNGTSVWSRMGYGHIRCTRPRSIRLRVPQGACAYTSMRAR